MPSIAMVPMQIRVPAIVGPHLPVKIAGAKNPGQRCHPAFLTSGKDNKRDGEGIRREVELSRWPTSRRPHSCGPRNARTLRTKRVRERVSGAVPALRQSIQLRDRVARVRERDGRREPTRRRLLRALFTALFALFFMGEWGLSKIGSETRQKRGNNAEHRLWQRSR